MRQSCLLAFVGFVLLICLAGCVGSPVGEAEPRIKPRPNTESTTESPDDLSTLRSRAAGTTTVTITRMIDRETMEIENANGTEDTIRLLGVGTLETILSRVSSDGYPSVDDSTTGRDHLHEWARRQLHWPLESWKTKTSKLPSMPTRTSVGTSDGYLCTCMSTKRTSTTDCWLTAIHRCTTVSSVCERNSFRSRLRPNAMSRTVEL